MVTPVVVSWFLALAAVFFFGIYHVVYGRQTGRMTRERMKEDRKKGQRKGMTRVWRFVWVGWVGWDGGSRLLVENALEMALRSRCALRCDWRGRDWIGVDGGKL